MVNEQNGRTYGQSGTRRRSVLKATGAGAATLGLAGCSGIPGMGGGGGSDTIKIGGLLPLQHDMGKGAIRSARMAVEEINNNGGILDKDVELVEGDTAFSPSQANTLVQEMVNSDNVNMILGTFASETMLGIIDRVGAANVPFLDTGSASPKITANYPAKDYDKFKNIFRPNPMNANFQADLLADYGKFLSDQHGYNSFAVVVEDAEWTKPVTNRTAKRMREKHGLTVTMNERIAPDTSDFTPILDSVEESGAKVMMKAISHIPGTSMLSTWGANEYPFLQEGINVASMSPQYWSDTNGGCLYETTASSGAGGAAPLTEKTIPFAKAYAEKYNERPTAPMYLGFGSYDAVHLFKDRVENAGTANYKKDLDTIVQSLENSDFTGTIGNITFFPKDHDYAHDVQYGVDLVPFPVQQWQTKEQAGDIPFDVAAGQPGTKVTVWPEKYATGDHVLPPWMS